jgi:predicted Co/Zn/Cd cation transporter (cation efflux family)
LAFGRGSSLVVGAGGGVAWLLRGTALDGVEPYADSALVLLSCLLLPVPARLIRSAVRDLQDAAPPSVVEAEVPYGMSPLVQGRMMGIASSRSAEP